MRTDSPRVLVLDGDNVNTLSVARELSEDLDATIIGVGTAPYSRLLRSNYCDVGATAPAPTDDGYADSVLRLLIQYRPDVVLPISYESVAMLDAIRTDLPDHVSLPIPRSESLDTAKDKHAALAAGGRIGVDTPKEYSRAVDHCNDAGRPDDGFDDVQFPVFLKARQESGGETTALVREPLNFWETYDHVTDQSPDGDVLIQEVIDEGGPTYGCGLLFLDNEVKLIFSHEELRSVPRRGGSGTHLRILRDPHLEARSIRLLREIGWNGIALLEFKKRPDGTYVLMEINPKFWASYALASRYGYRFASALVAGVLDDSREPPIGSPEPVGEMVFPLREFTYYLRNREDEDLFECVRSMINPSATWSVDRRDVRAWVTPPVELIEKFRL